MDNFDLTKFLKENKSLENLNPTFKSLNENKSLKDEIREMILAELNEDTTTDEAHDPVYENELEEAKKDEEKVEDVEMTDVEIEDAPEEDADEAPATSGGLEDIAADMEGTEGDLMDALMKSLKIAKGMGNEKLETQIGNTLKFFVSEYIGGEEK
jgi:hypothetical protein